MENNDYAIKLEFNASSSESEKQKIKNIWAFLAGDGEIEPYIPPAAIKKKIGNKMKKSSQETKGVQCDAITLTKTMKNSRQFLSSQSTETKCMQSLIFRPKDLKFADEVEEPYQVLDNELKAFEDRLRLRDQIRIDELSMDDVDSFEDSCFG